jgi:DNA-3-methyladenine glycosylase II
MAATVSKKRGAGKGAGKRAAKGGAKGARRKAAAKARAKAPAKVAAPRKAKATAKKPAAKAKSRPAAKAKSRPAATRRRRAPAKLAPVRYHPGPPITDEAGLVEATARLLALDPEVVALLIEIGGPPRLRLRAPGFAGLAAIIVSQQVSVASANAIFGRLEAALSPLDAGRLHAADEATLKSAGLSQPKIRALRALAVASHEGLDLAALAGFDAHDAHKALVAVKGIGPWTADIFLLSCLGHADAFPAGDLALQEAAKLALGLKRRPDARKLEEIAERWRPLRGVAARMLWAYYGGVKRRAGVIGQELARAPRSR